VTTFFFAAHEDVIFVGFIQTRLYGFFKTDKVAITVGALLFALMHIPPWLVMGRIDTSNLLMGIGLPFVSWFIFHLVFVSIFKKYYSLVPVFILHTIINYSWNFAQTTTVLGIDFSLILFSLFVLAAAILFWHTHKQSKKAMTE
jgi:membrane protease YdiL (CAAX protease family)